MRYEIWKGKKKTYLAIGGLELGSIVSKSTHLTIYTTETDAELASFFSLDYPNQYVSGRSLCK